MKTLYRILFSLLTSVLLLSSCQQKNLDIPVQSVVLSETGMTIVAGNSKKLDVHVLPEDATDKALLWSTSNSAVATVDNGVVTALSEGTATIRATSKSSPASYSECKLTVLADVIPAKSFRLDREELSMTLGNQYEFSCRILPENSSYTEIVWSSSNPEVVSIYKGMAYAKSEGEALVTAELAGTEFSANCKVVVVKETIPAQSISVDPSGSVELLENQQVVVFAKVLPENTTQNKLDWESSNTEVATVYNGVITAMGPGSCTVTARVEGSDLSQALDVNVTCPVLAVDFNEHSCAMNVGQTFQLQAKVLPERASNKALGWESSDDNVVTVDDNGKVTAVAKGAAVVTATSGYNNNIKASCTFTVLSPVEGVSLEEDRIDILIGEKKKLNLLFTPEDPSDPSATWTSKNPEIAVVDKATGEVTGKSYGSTEIYAVTHDGGNVLVCHIYVYEPVKSLTVYFEDKALNLKQGESVVVGPMTDLSLTAVAEPQGKVRNTDVIWTSDDFNFKKGTDTRNECVVEVRSDDGSVTVKSVENEKASATVNIEIVQHVQEVKLDKSSATIYAGDESEIVATVSPAKVPDTSLSWEVVDSSVAEIVSKSGDTHTVTVRGKKAGTTSITATSNDSKDKSGTCVVTVKYYPDVTAVRISAADNINKLYEGEKLQLEASVTPEDTQRYTVEWKPSDDKVATVDANGLVTAKAAGSVRISATVTSHSGKTVSASYQLAVVAHVESVAVEPKEIKLEVNHTSLLTASVLPEGANQDVTWESSNTDVVLVSGGGGIRAVGEGTAVITATSKEDSSKYATCTVSVVKETVKISSVTFDVHEKTLKAGNSFTITASILPENADNKELEWTSSNSDLTVVDGLVTLKADSKAKNGTEYTVTATAKDGSGKSDSCKIIVEADIPVGTLTLSHTGTQTLQEGKTLKLSVSVLPSDATNKSVTWSSSNTTVATVADDGTVTAKTPGTATITVTSVSTPGVSASVTFNVEAKPADIHCTDVAIKKYGENEICEAVTISVNGTIELEAVVTPENTTDVGSWYHKIEPPFECIPNGRRCTVIGNFEGKAPLFYNIGEQQGQIMITVKIQPVTSVILDKSQLSLREGGDSVTLTATVGPEDATYKTVRWASDNTAVATVDSNGKVTPKAKGTCHVTATEPKSGLFATCEVRVAPENVGEGGTENLGFEEWN